MGGPADALGKDVDAPGGVDAVVPPCATAAVVPDPGDALTVEDPPPVEPAPTSPPAEGFAEPPVAGTAGAPPLASPPRPESGDGSAGFGGGGTVARSSASFSDSFACVS